MFKHTAPSAKFSQALLRAADKVEPTNNNDVTVTFNTDDHLIYQHHGIFYWGYDADDEWKVYIETVRECYPSFNRFHNLMKQKFKTNLILKAYYISCSEFCYFYSQKELALFYPTTVLRDKIDHLR